VKAVFDTSPISYLVLIAEIELLPALYNRRFIPTAVAAELGHPKSPTRLRSWIASPPAWLEIHPVRPRLSRDLDRLQMESAKRFSWLRSSGSIRWFSTTWRLEKQP
jgi:predicted nucleic acid-binding protein